MGKNLLVGQSGGPTAAINASLAGVISEGLKSKEIDKIYGTRYGVEGILKETLIDLSYFNNEENINYLKQTPSAYLGSCRKKLPDVEADISVYETIYKVFKKYDIGYFFYIGGNDSMDTVNKLSKYFDTVDYDVKIVGVPKTIDNDLVLTDHTPGFGSAAKFVANTIKQVSYDNMVYDMPSVTVVEIMGRHAGWLTAAAALANSEDEICVDFICLPEVPFDIDKLSLKVTELAKTKKNIVIALSEGVKGEDGKLICETVSATDGKADGFNHAQLGGAGKTVEILLKEKTGFKVRSIELSTLQRCFSALLSETDIKESQNIGSEAVKFALSGKTGIMAAYKRTDSCDYNIEYTAVSTKDVANFEKIIPKSMISEDGFNVTEEFIRYARPLVNGTYNVIFDKGIIKTIRL